MKWAILLLLMGSPLFAANKIITGPEGHLQYINDAAAGGDAANITFSTISTLFDTIIATEMAIRKDTATLAALPRPSLQNPATGYFQALGIGATSYAVGGIDLLRSTWSAHSMEGYTLTYTSGNVAANTSITISATNLGGTALWGVVCSEIELVNTAVVSVRVKALVNMPVSFDLYNADAINEKRFGCFVGVKP